MPQLLYAAELTPEVPDRTVALDKFAFCELNLAVLNWEQAHPLAQWLVEVCPGKNRSYFAVCRLTTEHPEAILSCIALPEGAIRLVALNEHAKAAKGVSIHVTGDLDPTGEVESFYAVSCIGQQDWKISSEVEFFETFSVVIRTPELVRKENRAYVQLQHKNRWINIAHIPGDRMWTLVKDRLVVKGDRIRCVLIGPDAQKPYVWDIVTALDDLTEKSDDDQDSYLAEAEEVASEDIEVDSEEESQKGEPVGFVDESRFVRPNVPIETIDVDDTDDEKSSWNTDDEVDSAPSLIKRQRPSPLTGNKSKSAPSDGSPSKRARLSQDIPVAAVDKKCEDPPVPPPSSLEQSSPSPHHQITVEIDSDGDDDFVVDGVAEDKTNNSRGREPFTLSQGATDSPRNRADSASPKINRPSRAAKKAMCATSPLSPNVSKKTPKGSKSKTKVQSAKVSASPSEPSVTIRAVGKSRVLNNPLARKNDNELSESPKATPAKKETKSKPALTPTEGAAMVRNTKNTGDASPPREESPVSPNKSEIEAKYLKEIRAILKDSGPCRLSTLGARIKKPPEVQKKLVDFLKSSGEFEFKNTDVVLLKKK